MESKESQYRFFIEGLPLSDLMGFYRERSQHDALFIRILMEEFRKKNIDPQSLIEEENTKTRQISDEIERKTIHELAYILNNPYQHRFLTKDYINRVVEIFRSKITTKLKEGDAEALVILKEYNKRQSALNRWNKCGFLFSVGPLLNIGTKYYGKMGDREDKSYITTLWFVICHFPIFPLWSVRVKRTGNDSHIPGIIIPLEYKSKEFLIMDGGKPNPKQVITTCLIVWVPFIILVFFIVCVL